MRNRLRVSYSVLWLKTSESMSASYSNPLEKNDTRKDFDDGPRRKERVKYRESVINWAD